MAGRLSNEEKLELMLEYTRVTGEKIKAHTEYKGYQIGHIRNNLRQAYFNGTLKMEEELLKRFIENGIINEKKERKKKATTKEKYDFLIKLAGKSERVIQKATMGNGLPFTTVRNSLQAKYNNGELDLTEEQIANLISAGFLNYSKEEQAEAMRKYGIPARYVQDTARKYGSYEEFLVKYKNKEVDYTFGDDVFTGARCVILSEEDVSATQKLAYYNLVKAIKENIQIEPLAYIDIDELENILAEHLSIRENQIIKLRFEFDGKKHSLDDCVKILGLTLPKVRQLEQSAINKLLSSNTVQRFLGFGKKDERSLEEYKLEYDDIEGYIKDFNAIRKFITDEEGNLKSEIPNVRLAEIGVSGKIFADGIVEDKTMKDLLESAQPTKPVITEETLKTSIETLELSARAINGLKRNAINTIDDLIKISELELINKKYIGLNTAKEIIVLLRSKGINLKTSEEEEEKRRREESLANVLNVCNIKLDEYITRRVQIWDNMDRLIEIVRRYKIAYDNYINKENLFNRDEIIPAVYAKKAKTVKKVSIEELLKERTETGSELAELETEENIIEQKVKINNEDLDQKPETNDGASIQQPDTKTDIQTLETTILEHIQPVVTEQSQVEIQEQGQIAVLEQSQITIPEQGQDIVPEQIQATAQEHGQVAILEQEQTEEKNEETIKIDGAEELAEMIDAALESGNSVEEQPDKLPEIARLIEITPNSSQEQSAGEEEKQLEAGTTISVDKVLGNIGNSENSLDEEELDAWIEGIAKAEKIKEAAKGIQTDNFTLEGTEDLSIEILEEQKMRRALLNSIKDSQQQLNELKEQLAKFRIEGEKIDE